jgi:signal transduction histidine kinase
MAKELVDGFVHEVRNPLASIKGALKILREKMAPDDPNRAVMEKIYDLVGNINEAISDLVDFSQILPPETSPTDMNNVLEQALDRIHLECERQEIDIQKDFSGDLPEIRIDARQIELAFLLLFSDTLKAMPDGGELVVRSSWDPQGQVVVEIADTGASIPEIQMERLFKPFLSTRGRGAGTGLAKVKRIVNQNGGFIHAKNRGEEGLTFRIVFPWLPT